MKKLLFCGLALMNMAAIVQAKKYTTPQEATAALKKWVIEGNNDLTAQEIKEALDAGADVNEKTAIGPFIFGSMLHGSNIDSSNAMFGKSANGMKDLFDALLAHKDIKLDVKNHLGFSTLDMAAMATEHNIHYLDTLVTHTKFKKDIPTLLQGIGDSGVGNTYLNYAKAINLLLNHPKATKENINKPSFSNDKTILFGVLSHLSQNSPTAIAELLSNPKIDINATDKKGKTVLHYLLEEKISDDKKNDQKEIFNAILAHKDLLPDIVTRKDNDGVAPLDLIEKKRLTNLKPILENFGKKEENKPEDPNNPDQPDDVKQPPVVPVEVLQKNLEQLAQALTALKK